MGYATLFYNWFISKGYNIISDMVQFDGDRKLFDKLSRNKKIQADIIDDQEAIILKYDTRVYSGEEDWDFDTDIWSHSHNKNHIRIALYLK